MTESTKLFLFPDINVWVALTYNRHAHHITALEWFENLPPMVRLFFCRLTQLGLLRLLSAAVVMGPDQVKVSRKPGKPTTAGCEMSESSLWKNPVDSKHSFEH